MKLSYLLRLSRLLIFLFSILLFSCQTEEITVNQKDRDRPPALPQHDLIKVYFNHNLARQANYTDPYRKIERPGDNLEAIIIKEIEAAKDSIDLAVFELNLPLIARALVKKSQEGIKVRVIIDRRNRHSLSQLDAAKIGRLKPREKKN
nr:phospholipase D-like domain-containing protein [Prochloraceae cyanobacterium]